jgi:thermostable 8-oxoguanine DNA glycosylase
MNWVNKSFGGERQKNKFMIINDLEKYIALYDTERYLFDVVGPKTKKRGYLIFDDFYKICMWKSARQKQRYIKNKQKIGKITKKALIKKDEKEKIKILCDGLEGVGIPTASAILTVVFPQKYAIIDVRCLGVLREKFNIKISKYITVNSWLKYLSLMREISKENNITPRELDMVLFAMHRELLENKDYRNLY